MAICEGEKAFAAHVIEMMGCGSAVFEAYVWRLRRISGWHDVRPDRGQ